MKKLLLIAGAALSFTNAFGAMRINQPTKFGSDIIGQEFSNFIQLEKGHCDDWFNFKLSKETRCIEMAKRHHDECADLKSKFVKMINKTGLTKEQLIDAIDLHKKHEEECKKFDKDIYNEKLSISDAHEKEFEAFEKNPNVLPKFKTTSTIPVSNIPGSRIKR